jgi:hypothetical protein
VKYVLTCMASTPLFRVSIRHGRGQSLILVQNVMSQGVDVDVREEGVDDERGHLASWESISGSVGLVEDDYDSNEMADQA